MKIRIRKYLLSTSILMGLLFAQTAFSAGTLDGTVYLDHDDDGTFSGADAAVSAATIKVYNSAGEVCSTTTNGSGVWTCSMNAGNDGPYRVELDGVPKPEYVSAAVAGGIDSSVLFVPDGSRSGVDFGLKDSNDGTRIIYSYADDSDDINLIRKIGIGYYQYTEAYEPSTGSFFNDRIGTPIYDETKDAPKAGYIGGIAVQPSTDTLYASSYLKVGGWFGTGGSGAIYAVDPTPTAPQSNPTLFLDVDDYFGDGIAGADTSCDFTGRDCTLDVGRRGLGDLDISRDEQTLFSINQSTKELYVFPIPNGVAPTVASGDATRHTIPHPASCPAADELVVSALATHPSGKTYIGAVCTADSTQDKANLLAYVIEFGPETKTFSAAPVLEFSLDYRYSSPVNRRWNPWDTATIPVSHSQALVGDLEFDGNDLIIGLSDRFNDGNNSQDEAMGGSLLKACWNGASWDLEADGFCGGVEGTRTAKLGPDPSGRSFYKLLNEEFGNTTGVLVQVPGKSDIVVSMHDAYEQNYTSGVMHGSNATGRETGAGEYAAADETFGKGNAMGDLEYISLSPVIELGNRIWEDTDEDGIQDPGEANLAGVVVGLYSNNGTLIDTVTSDANGNYLFSSDSSKVDVSGKNYGVDIGEGANYTIAILDSNFSGGSLAGRLITTANAEGDTSNNLLVDVRDSDAVTVAVGTGTDAALLGVSFVTGAGGDWNKHSFDFGFRVTPAVAFCSGNLLQNGSFESPGSNTQDLDIWLDGVEATNSAGLTPKPDGLFYAVQNAGASFIQDVAISGTNTYTMTFHAGSHDPATENNVVHLQYLDASDSLISEVTHTISHDVDLTTPQTLSPERTLSLGVSPANATKIRVSVETLAGYSKIDAMCLLATASVTPKTELSINKTVNVASATSGQTIIYTLTVNNNSSIDATGVVVADPLPSVVTYVSDDGGATTSESNGTVTWNLGNVNANSSAILNITVTVN